LKKLCSILLAVGACIAAVAAAQAMPHAARIASFEGALTPVSSGCGLGVQRGPLNNCIPIYPDYPTYPTYSDSHSKGYYYRGPVRARTTSPIQSPQRPPLPN
jgi:hypothetical protein